MTKTVPAATLASCNFIFLIVPYCDEYEPKFTNIDEKNVNVGTYAAYGQSSIRARVGRTTGSPTSKDRNWCVTDPSHLRLETRYSDQYPILMEADCPEAGRQKYPLQLCITNYSYEFRYGFRLSMHAWCNSQILGSPPGDNDGDSDDDKDNEMRLMSNMSLQIAFCRLKYRRDKHALPGIENIEAQAKYWKRVYNSSLGRGTVEHFIKINDRFTRDIYTEYLESSTNIERQLLDTDYAKYMKRIAHNDVKRAKIMINIHSNR